MFKSRINFKILENISSIKDADAKDFLENVFDSYCHKKEKSKSLEKEAKQIIKVLNKNKILKIDRDVIFLKDCLSDLGKSLDYNKFDHLLEDYRNLIVN